MAQLKYMGLSRDERTNKWKIICDCGKEFYPQTTLLSKQHIECPKCHNNYFANYNAERKPQLNLLNN